MVVVVVDPFQQFPDRRPLQLAGPVAMGDLIIPVTGAVPTYNPAWPYLLIEDPVNGNEWVRFSNFDEATSSFVLSVPADRGVRGTADVDHAGVGPLGPYRVRIGFTFSRVFQSPSGKEYWG